MQVKVQHIMRNGTIRTDIDGHIVKRADVREVYNLIEQINKRKGEKR